MTMTGAAHSIFVTAYFGDMDTFNESHIIGPYPSGADRDRDLTRLAGLPGNNGDAVFSPTSQNPAEADHSCTPEQVAGIKHFNQVVGGLYGYKVGDDGEDIPRVAAVTSPGPARRRVAAPPAQDTLPGLDRGDE